MVDRLPPVPLRLTLRALSRVGGICVVRLAELRERLVFRPWKRRRKRVDPANLAENQMNHAADVPVLVGLASKAPDTQ
ncbi:hypothetical protein AWB74_05839 [Caballeronia arvi]|uniref:Uncharacterized protein n=1 Tax=Caballeronia arvi TaxID=1777135 RepID=A0A158KIQ7_9BURK|nr:hypothetical protein AWB74_05839 [Caballeronia arvi]